MATGILHLHLLLALIFLVALWKATGAWARIAGAVGVLLLLTGLFNFMTRMAGAPGGWHMIVGIKILLALHALAVSLMMMRGMDAAKAARMKKGALASAVLVTAIGLYVSNVLR